jgi:hypothetical protein
MSATAVKPLFELFPETASPEDAARQRFAGSGPTLEQRISGVWEGLLKTGTADCPVCRGKMERTPGGGLCTSCGSTLS